MPDSLRVSAVLPASPDAVRDAWLSADGHEAMTGAPATVGPDGRFTAWDGYIEGTTVSVEDGRIVQRWRTSEFPDDAPDSTLEIRLEAVPGGTRVTLDHREIPDGQGPAYEGGWEEFYFAPMRAWFGR